MSIARPSSSIRTVPWPTYETALTSRVCSPAWQTGRPHVGGWLWPGRSSSWASCSQWSPWSRATSATRRSTTKRSGNTSEELIADPVIRDQIATTLVEQLYGNVDVEAELEQRLPPDQQGLAGPLAAATRELGDRAAHRLLERPRAQELWVNLVTRAHRQLIDVLEDDTGAISTEGGVVVLDLQPLVIQVGEQVAVFGAVAERLGPDAGRIEIMEADQLETAQDLTQLFDKIAAFIWIVPFLLWAIALWLARGRRRPILRTISLGLVVGGLLVLVARNLGGELRRGRARRVGCSAACRAEHVGHRHRAPGGRRLDDDRYRRGRAPRCVARRPITEWNRGQARAGALPGAPRARVRRRHVSLPPAPPVGPRRPDAAPLRRRCGSAAPGAGARGAPAPGRPRVSRRSRRRTWAHTREAPLRGCVDPAGAGKS